MQRAKRARASSPLRTLPQQQTRNSSVAEAPSLPPTPQSSTQSTPITITGPDSLKEARQPSPALSTSSEKAGEMSSSSGGEVIVLSTSEPSTPTPTQTQELITVDLCASPEISKDDARPGLISSSSLGNEQSTSTSTSTSTTTTPTTTSTVAPGPPQNGGKATNGITFLPASLLGDASVSLEANLEEAQGPLHMESQPTQATRLIEALLPSGNPARLEAAVLPRYTRAQLTAAVGCIKRFVPRSTDPAQLGTLVASLEGEQALRYLLQMECTMRPPKGARQPVSKEKTALQFPPPKSWWNTLGHMDILKGTTTLCTRILHHTVRALGLEEILQSHVNQTLLRPVLVRACLALVRRFAMDYELARMSTSLAPLLLRYLSQSPPLFRIDALHTLILYTCEPTAMGRLARGPSSDLPSKFSVLSENANGSANGQGGGSQESGLEMIEKLAKQEERRGGAEAMGRGGMGALGLMARQYQTLTELRGLSRRLGMHGEDSQRIALRCVGLLRSLLSLFTACWPLAPHFPREALYGPSQFFDRLVDSPSHPIAPSDHTSLPEWAAPFHKLPYYALRYLLHVDFVGVLGKLVGVGGKARNELLPLIRTFLLSFLSTSHGLLILTLRPQSTVHLLASLSPPHMHTETHTHTPDTPSDLEKDRIKTETPMDEQVWHPYDTELEGFSLDWLSAWMRAEKCCGTGELEDADVSSPASQLASPDVLARLIACHLRAFTVLLRLVSCSPLACSTGPPPTLLPEDREDTANSLLALGRLLSTPMGHYAVAHVLAMYPPLARSVVALVHRIAVGIQKQGSKQSLRHWELLSAAVSLVHSILSSPYPHAVHHPWLFDSLGDLRNALGVVLNLSMPVLSVPYGPPTVANAAAQALITETIELTQDLDRTVPDIAVDTLHAASSLWAMLRGVDVAFPSEKTDLPRHILHQRSTEAFRHYLSSPWSLPAGQESLPLPPTSLQPEGIQDTSDLPDRLAARPLHRLLRPLRAFTAQYLYTPTEYPAVSPYLSAPKQMVRQVPTQWPHEEIYELQGCIRLLHSLCFRWALADGELPEEIAQKGPSGEVNSSQGVCGEQTKVVHQFDQIVARAKAIQEKIAQLGSRWPDRVAPDLPHTNTLARTAAESIARALEDRRGLTWSQSASLSPLARACESVTELLRVIVEALPSKPTMTFDENSKEESKEVDNDVSVHSREPLFLLTHTCLAFLLSSLSTHGPAFLPSASLLCPLLHRISTACIGYLPRPIALPPSLCCPESVSLPHWPFLRFYRDGEVTRDVCVLMSVLKSCEELLGLWSLKEKRGGRHSPCQHLVSAFFTSPPFNWLPASVLLTSTLHYTLHTTQASTPTHLTAAEVRTHWTEALAWCAKQETSVHKMTLKTSTYVALRLERMIVTSDLLFHVHLCRLQSLLLDILPQPPCLTPAAPPAPPLLAPLGRLIANPNSVPFAVLIQVFSVLNACAQSPGSRGHVLRFLDRSDLGKEVDPSKPQFPFPFSIFPRFPSPTHVCASLRTILVNAYLRAKVPSAIHLFLSALTLCRTCLNQSTDRLSETAAMALLAPCFLFLLPATDGSVSFLQIPVLCTLLSATEGEGAMMMARMYRELVRSGQNPCLALFLRLTPKVLQAIQHTTHPSHTSPLDDPLASEEPSPTPTCELDTNTVLLTVLLLQLAERLYDCIPPSVRHSPHVHNKPSAHADAVDLCEEEDDSDGDEQRDLPQPFLPVDFLRAFRDDLRQVASKEVQQAPWYRSLTAHLDALLAFPASPRYKAPPVVSLVRSFTAPLSVGPNGSKARGDLTHAVRTAEMDSRALSFPFFRFQPGAPRLVVPNEATLQRIASHLLRARLQGTYDNTLASAAPGARDGSASMGNKLVSPPLLYSFVSLLEQHIPLTEILHLLPGQIVPDAPGDPQAPPLSVVKPWARQGASGPRRRVALDGPFKSLLEFARGFQKMAVGSEHKHRVPSNHVDRKKK